MTSAYSAYPNQGVAAHEFLTEVTDRDGNVLGAAPARTARGHSGRHGL